MKEKVQENNEQNSILTEKAQLKHLKLAKSQLTMSKRWKQSGRRISVRLRDIIHGYIMSDGYLNRGILTIDQGEKQLSFVQWLYTALESLRTKTSKISKVTRIHPKTHKTSYSYRFNTRTLLHGFQHIWYQPIADERSGSIKYQKRLPKNIAGFFTPTFISVWFAGDGTNIIGSAGAKFEVTSFTEEERLRLQCLFLHKYDIRTIIISSGDSDTGNPQWALKIPAEEYLKFRDLITKTDLVPKLFSYKINYDA
jgi:hypothetical protein